MKTTSLLAFFVATGFFANAASAAMIETVPVGNPGNQAYGGGFNGNGAVTYEYRIGKYEVTAGQYTEFLNAVAGIDTYSLYNASMANTAFGSGITRSGSGTLGDPYTYNVDAAFVNRPVNYVNWGDAARFVNWLHNSQPSGEEDLTTTEDGAYFLNGATSAGDLVAVTREADWQWALPTNNEWIKAAHHKNDGTTSNYFAYPTSSDTAPGRDLADVSGNNANFRDDSLGPYPIDSPYYTTVVGEFQDSDSPYGTFDQGGNVQEWGETVYGGTAYGTGGGGSAYPLGASGMLISFSPSNASPLTENNYLGFRVVALAEVPEPGTLLLAALACAGMLLQTRRSRS